jgi:uncharacterized membrane protein YuzA (DUF378 family)
VKNGKEYNDQKYVCRAWGQGGEMTQVLYALMGQGREMTQVLYALMGQGGEMTQVLYAHMNNKRKKKYVCCSLI